MMGIMHKLKLNESTAGMKFNIHMLQLRFKRNMIPYICRFEIEEHGYGKFTRSYKCIYI